MLFSSTTTHKKYELCRVWWLLSRHISSLVFVQTNWYMRDLQQAHLQYTKIIQGIKCSLINLYNCSHPVHLCFSSRRSFCLMLMVFFCCCCFLLHICSCSLNWANSHILAICTHIAKSVENPTVNLNNKNHQFACTDMVKRMFKSKSNVNVPKWAKTLFEPSKPHDV